MLKTGGGVMSFLTCGRDEAVLGVLARTAVLPGWVLLPLIGVSVAFMVPVGKAFGLGLWDLVDGRSVLAWMSRN